MPFLLPILFGFSVPVFLQDEIFPGAALDIWNVLNQFRDVTVKSLAYSVKMLKGNPLSELIVVAADR